MTKGKELEALVKFIESTLLPDGFDVEANERVTNDDGRQIAEFDVIIRGMVGSTDFTWLIECRDRPSGGPAPGSWIEQLVGRRDRFKFNKVTAVSTTGFAAGAKEFAESRGIELREVRSIEPSEFSWIEICDIPYIKRVSKLVRYRLLVDEAEDGELVAALQSLIADSAPIMLRTSDGTEVEPNDAFCAALGQADDPFAGLEEGQTREVVMHANYPEKRFTVVTGAGPIQLPGIVFAGEIWIEKQMIPMVSSALYQRDSGQETISQLAAFAPIETQHGNFALEFHRMGEKGETHVVVRRLTD